MGQAAFISGLKLLKALLVLTINPAGGSILDRFIDGIHPILILKPGHGDIKLENTHRTKNIITADKRPKDLHGTFLSKLHQAFLQLFCLQGIL